tara:strand:+ start:1404 stop:2174 length:771 start_codon:yes stop_codon:yes gene_type:complete
MNNIVISGTSSGLGRYLKENLNSYSYDRNGSNTSLPLSKNNIIIHTAFNSSKVVSEKEILNYIDDNINLTKRILEVPHKKIIFISSVDVYPTNNKIHKEEDELLLESNKSIYSLSKLIAESIIRKKSSNYVILRVSGMLGPYIRDNAFIKILKNSKCIDYKNLSLNQTSSFNYVLQSDILNLIKKLLKNNDTGTYNLTSNKNINLERIATHLNSKINFGKYIYNVGKNSNHRVIKKYGIFNKTSLQVIKEYLKEYE